MSYLVLHMDKFKKEAVRGIQRHNRRECERHSNPDIDYQRSRDNYELHDKAATNYAQAIQRRIDDLQLIKAVRKDAVHMCGLIVTSDSDFLKVFLQKKPDASSRKARPFSRILWGRKMSFPRWCTWMKKRRTYTFFMCP